MFLADRPRRLAPRHPSVIGRLVRSLGASVLVIASVPPAMARRADPPAAPDDAAARCAAVLDEYEAWARYEFPEAARRRGRATREDSLAESGLSPEGRRVGQRRVFLEDIEAIPPASLGEAERLDRSLLRWTLQREIDRYDEGLWLQPIGPMHGPHLSLLAALDGATLDDRTACERYLKRLSWLPQNVRNATEVLREAVRLDVLPSRSAIEPALAQARAAVGPALDALEEPFRHLPASIAPGERTELVAAFHDRLRPDLAAAFDEFLGVLEREYLPKCRTSLACAAWGPAGGALYASLLAQETTSPLGPDAAHALGEAEVARLRDEMLAAVRRTPWFAEDQTRWRVSDDDLLAGFLAFLRDDPRFRFAGSAPLLEAYRATLAAATSAAPRFFGRLPRRPCQVEAMPRSVGVANIPAYYAAGAPNGDEAAWCVVNVARLEQHPTFAVRAIALHEAVPGHHLQAALAEETPGLRDFRRDLAVPAFSEGWALYAERLGAEMGLFADPYDDVGRLASELLRACRLVVDTGIHAKGWSLDQAQGYLRARVPLSEASLRYEIERIVAYPGQASAYTLGFVAIRGLRERAERRLGPAFRLSDFHDELLGAGALPLQLLDERIERWIAAREAATTPSGGA